jgi:purine nucleoside phosphorylase
MIGDYPTRGWKFRAFLALVVVIGLTGIVLMTAVGGVMKQ